MPTVLPSFKPTSLPTQSSLSPEAQDSSSSSTSTIDSSALSVLLLLIGVAVFVVGAGSCIVVAIHRRGWCHDLDKESPAPGSVDTLKLELSELPKASDKSLSLIRGLSMRSSNTKNSAARSIESL